MPGPLPHSDPDTQNFFTFCQLSRLSLAFRTLTLYFPLPRTLSSSLLDGEFLLRTQVLVRCDLIQEAFRHPPSRVLCLSSLPCPHPHVFITSLSPGRTTAWLAASAAYWKGSHWRTESVQFTPTYSFSSVPSVQAAEEMLRPFWRLVTT